MFTEWIDVEDETFWDWYPEVAFDGYDPARNWEVGLDGGVGGGYVGRDCSWGRECCEPTSDEL